MIVIAVLLILIGLGGFIANGQEGFNSLSDTGEGVSKVDFYWDSLSTGAKAGWCVVILLMILISGNWRRRKNNERP
jgi:hypothetical protein